MERVRNIQTRDCFYSIYEERESSAFYNPAEFSAGFYFYDDEMECNTIDSPSCYIGPYPNINSVIEAQYKHYLAIMSL